jgi:hypothetical protein
MTWFVTSIEENWTNFSIVTVIGKEPGAKDLNFYRPMTLGNHSPRLY